MIKIQSILLAASLCFAGTVSLHAESFEQHFGVAPGQLTSANVQSLTGYSTLQAAYSAYLCSQDMERREALVRADRATYINHLQEWLQKNKDADNARRLAEATARQAEIEARQKALQDALTRSVIRANDAYSNYMESR